MSAKRTVPGHYVIRQVAEMRGTSRQAADLWSRGSARRHFVERDGLRCIRKDVFKRLMLMETIALKLEEIEEKHRNMYDMTRDAERRMNVLVQRITRIEKLLASVKAA